MKQDYSWEAGTHTPGRNLPSFMKLKGSIPGSQEPSKIPILSQMNRVHNITHCRKISKEQIPSLLMVDERRKKARALTQAVSRRLTTTAARVRSKVRSCGICGGKLELGQVFSEYFGFPCRFSFHQMLRNHLSTEAGIIGQVVADVPSALSLNPLKKITTTISNQETSVEKEKAGKIFFRNVGYLSTNMTLYLR
jgi:hypothetical protein